MIRQGDGGATASIPPVDRDASAEEAGGEGVGGSGWIRIRDNLGNPTIVKKGRGTGKGIKG